jgi:hypothetical protein
VVLIPVELMQTSMSFAPDVRVTKPSLGIRVCGTRRKGHPHSPDSC